MFLLKDINVTDADMNGDLKISKWLLWPAQDVILLIGKSQGDRRKNSAKR